MVGRRSSTADIAAEARKPAWGYVETADIEPGEALLDRVAAMLHRLGARR